MKKLIAFSKIIAFLHNFTVIACAHKRRTFTVYADETRPLLQGSRLTAWELKEMGYDEKFIEMATEGLIVYVTRASK